MENLNLLFYKTFYDKLGQNLEQNDFEQDVSKKAKRLVDSKFYEWNYQPVTTYTIENDENSKNEDTEEKPDIANQKFLMETSYPGLIVGIGYDHGIDIDSDIKVGFSFDYVTGQPYIPGSSVKGLLRSYFEYPEVIEELLGDGFPQALKGEGSKSFVKKLENDIFENDDESSSNVDVFFDAIVKHGDKNGKVLSFDYITPHIAGVTKNPIPIKILKVLPEVVFEFSFNLRDSAIDEYTIAAEKKKALFEAVIKHFGIGAKTNVGYGMLHSITYAKDKYYVYPVNKDDNKPQNGNNNNNNSKNDFISRESLEVGKLYHCIVEKIEQKRIRVKIKNTNIYGSIHISEIKSGKVKNIYDEVNVGEEITVKLISIWEGKPNFSIKQAR